MRIRFEIKYQVYCKYLDGRIEVDSEWYDRQTARLTAKAKKMSVRRITREVFLPLSDRTN
jgi:hypothetical protein